jgi:hypothetical protein
METNNIQIPICQSCGMPMQNPEDFGTNADGSKNNDYCRYCRQNGEFTAKMDLDEFTEMQVKIAVEKMGMLEDEARAVAESTLPDLLRWKKQE